MNYRDTKNTLNKAIKNMFKVISLIPIHKTKDIFPQNVENPKFYLFAIFIFEDCFSLYPNCNT